ADRQAGQDKWLLAMYESITSQLPDGEESKTFLKMANDLEKIYADNPTLAIQMCQGITIPEGATPEKLAAWTMLASTIFNLDITKTRQ
ncbi:MAG: hypothetical protein N2C12_02870, partial [Planctomycetales bacterium]